MSGWSFIRDPGSPTQTDPPLHSQNLFLWSGDSLRGVLHSFDVSCAYADILHRSCNKNWVSACYVHQLSLHSSVCLGRFWTNGDWSSLPSLRLGLKTGPRWVFFPEVKERKEEGDVGGGSCVTAVREGLSGRSTRPPCSSWSCHGTWNHPRIAHCCVLGEPRVKSLTL